MFDALKPMGDILSAISKRQQVVTSNIANASTPGYTAKRLEFSQVLNKASNPFETSLSLKMGSAEGLEMETGEPVALHKEFVEMQKNLMYYSMASRRLSTIVTVLKQAAQSGR